MNQETTGSNNLGPQRNEGMSLEEAAFCMDLIAGVYDWTFESVERMWTLTQVLMKNPEIFWEAYFCVPTLEDQQWQS